MGAGRRAGGGFGGRGIPVRGAGRIRTMAQAMRLLRRGGTLVGAAGRVRRGMRASVNRLRGAVATARRRR